MLWCRKAIGGLLLCVLLVGQGWAAHEAIPYVFDRPGFCEWDTAPRVAVALGGGGARALVNVGVLKALDEAGVPIDLVTGTSMGALVAILYGSGMPPNQMEHLVTAVDLSSLFRLNLPFTRSLLDGSRFNEALERVVAVKQLEDFPIATALLSFDLNQGVKYVHTQGAVAEAVHAPYAIPGIFPGYAMGEFFLLDAGIQELAPALAAKEMGARMVITTTAFDQLPYSEYNSPIRAWMRMINLIKENYSIPIVDKYSDVVIAMDVGQHSMMDFHRGQMFVDYGYAQAQSMLPEILTAMAAKGIMPEYRSRESDPVVDEAITELLRRRWVASSTTYWPLGYFGSQQGFLAPQLFPTQDKNWQFGAAAEAGFFDGQVWINPFDFAGSAEIRRKYLTAQWDGSAAAGWTGQQTWAAGGLQYSGIDEQLRVGGLWRQEEGLTPFVHGQAQYDVASVEALLAGLPGTPQGYAAAEVGVPLYDPIRLRAAGVYTYGQWPWAPYIHRGLLVTAPVWQWNVETSYDRQWEYTKEILQIVQFTGIEFYQFIGNTSAVEQGLTVGGGLRFSLRLVGLKPSSFDLYTAYDFQEKESVFRLAVELSF